ncbi:ArsR family transcriptional regulator [Clostridium pascui]|uniref:ArsR/SmtB family transcription factor n=1 Tax=Clostridium pascui TaxID=46609 RepID=UPI0019598087|nr:metalloregulator ArsR/SmtB family transcription factor [Clostridium pascui]MBM7870542.1 ArsR family transcriptional regulator [Clostridium pascui]
MNNYNEELFKEKAELLKALAHPVRLCIVKGLLENGGCNVTHMQNCLNAPQSTISQHLQKLRSLGIIKGERNGLEIKYTVANPLVQGLVEALFKE